MALSVVNNNSSLNAQQNLNRTSSALSKSLERLSTGLKINRGGDGPSGLVISEQQRAQIAGLRTALDNSNKAVSLVQTAEGALNEINGLLTKARGLALDSANSGVNDASAQAANQAEIANILSSIDTIANTTKFGTKTLLNGAANDGAVTSLTSGVTTSGSLLAPTPANYKTYSFTTTAATVATTTGAGAFAVTAGGAYNINGLNVATLVVGDTADTAAAKINTGAAAAGVAVRADSVGGALRLTATDFKTDIVITTGATVTNGPADDARSAASVSYVNSLGATVVGGTGSVAAGVDSNLVAITAGELTGITVNLGNTTTAFTVGSPGRLQVGEKLTFQIGANAGETSTLSIARAGTSSIGVGAVVGVASLASINVTNTTGAQNAISVIDDAISDISNLRGTLGAFQANTLESNSRSLSATLENTVSAESIIRDTDFAQEIATFTRLQTQVQAGATVLGNANQTTALVAQLLRG